MEYEGLDVPLCIYVGNAELNGRLSIFFCFSENLPSNYVLDILMTLKKGQGQNFMSLNRLLNTMILFAKLIPKANKILFYAHFLLFSSLNHTEL